MRRFAIVVGLAAAACDIDGVAPDREQTLAVVIERKTALEAQPADPARATAFVAALDDFVRLAEPTDPELPKMRFLAAATQNRWHRPDALPRLEAILRGDRGDETVEYAANMLLDDLNRSGRYDEMAAWVDELLADGGFMAGKDELCGTLERLDVALATR